MINGKPVWTFSPNWGNGVLERLEWLTDVLASQSGAEQRRCLRMSPRREFEASFLLTGNERANFDISTFMAGGIEWYIPIWHEVVMLSTVLNSGSNTLPIDPANREFRIGDYVLLLGADAFTYEIVQVQGTSGGLLQLIANTVNTWGVGTKVYPLRTARYKEQPQVTKHTDTFIETHVGFRLTETNDFAATPTLDTYSGFPVLNARPDESEDLTHAYVRILSELDGQTGKVNTTDTAGRGFTTQQYRWAITGRAANAEFRRFLYAMRGRWKSFWLPTFMQDMTPTRDIGATDAFLYISAFGYTDFGGAVEGRKHIRIEKTDGTYVYCQITGSLNAGGNEEKINLNAAVGTAIAKSAIRSISYIALSRFDGDQIEINHETDGDGLTISAVTFRSAPGLRNSASWEPPAILAFTGSPNGCLPPCPIPTFVADDMCYTTSGDYNPVTNELWVMSIEGWNVAGKTRIGQRFRADTLAYVGPIDAQNTFVVGGVQAVQNGHDDPTFIFDAANNKAYTTWDLKVGGVVSMHILEFDATTGALNNCVKPTGTGIYTGAVRNRLHLSAAGDLWLTSQAGTNSIYFHKIDKTTLTPTASYTSSGVYPWDISGIPYMQGRYDNDGNFYFVSRQPSDKTVYKFNVSTHAFSIIYTETDPTDYPYALVVDTNRNYLYIVKQNTPAPMLEYDCTAGAFTGNSWSAYWFGHEFYDDNDAKLAFDATNGVIWGFSNWTGSGRGRFVGVKASDGTLFGFFDPEYNPEMPAVAEMYYGIIVPHPGQPNALYVSGSDSGGNNGIWKIPMCNIQTSGTLPS